MNRSLLKRVFPTASALIATFALFAAIGLAQDNTAPATGQRTDGQIEMDVVHALDASQALKNDLITAATIQSEVTLSGTVSSDASLKLAESIVKGVPGVTGVHNNLKVGNPANDPNAQGAVDDSASQDTADDNQPQSPAQPPTMASPDNNSQNQAPAYGQNQPPPDYGQNQPQNQPQYSQPGYTRHRAMARISRRTRLQVTGRTRRLPDMDRTRRQVTGRILLRDMGRIRIPDRMVHSTGHSILRSPRMKWPRDR